MESSIVFAGLVLAMCAIHLIRESSEQIAKWWARSRPEQSRASGKSKKKVIRSDWYVFFSCSDLWGKDPDKKPNQAEKPADKTRAKRNQRSAARV